MPKVANKPALDMSRPAGMDYNRCVAGENRPENQLLRLVQDGNVAEVERMIARNLQAGKDLIWSKWGGGIARMCIIYAADLADVEMMTLLLRIGGNELLEVKDIKGRTCEYYSERNAFKITQRQGYLSIIDQFRHADPLTSYLPDDLRFRELEKTFLTEQDEAQINCMLNRKFASISRGHSLANSTVSDTLSQAGSSLLTKENLKGLHGSEDSQWGGSEDGRGSRASKGSEDGRGSRASKGTGTESRTASAVAGTTASGLRRRTAAAPIDWFSEVRRPDTSGSATGRLKELISWQHEKSGKGEAVIAARKGPEEMEVIIRKNSRELAVYEKVGPSELDVELIGKRLAMNPSVAESIAGSRATSRPISRQQSGLALGIPGVDPDPVLGRQSSTTQGAELMEHDPFPTIMNKDGSLMEAPAETSRPTSKAGKKKKK